MIGHDLVISLDGGAQVNNVRPSGGMPCTKQLCTEL